MHIYLRDVFVKCLIQHLLWLIKMKNYMISYNQSPINMMLIHIWQQLGIKLLLKKE